MIIHVAVTTEQGHVFPLQVSVGEPVEDIQAILQVETGIPIAQQLLFHDGRVLEPSRSVEQSGIKDGDLLFIRQRQASVQQQQRQPRQTPTASTTSTTINPLDLAQQLQARMNRNQSSPSASQTPSQMNPNSQRQSTTTTTATATATANENLNLTLQQRLAESMRAAFQSPSVATSARAAAAGPPDATAVRDEILANDQLLSQVLERNPQLANAVLNGDLAEIERVVKAQWEARKAYEERVARIEADPMSKEAQEAIAADINAKNVQDNMELAMEHNPESFGRVVMLYINCQVNGINVKAFVDSGAQMTIMSESCAQRCNVTHLIDRRWSGMASGIGSAKIIGRIHVAPMRIGQSFFSSSFTVLENQSIELLIGLDMLRKHKCLIDLSPAGNCLRIGDERAPFLAEKDVPTDLQPTPATDDDDDDEQSSSSSSMPSSSPASQQ
jgi:DNA damage-inducible protein 1